MKFFKKYWQPCGAWALRTSLALRALIGAVATAAYGFDARIAFWCLVAGAVLDFILQCTGPDDKPPRSGNTIGVGVIVAFAFLLGGCRASKPAFTHEVTDSTWTVQKPVTVFMTGGTTAVTNMDSLRVSLGGVAVAPMPPRPNTAYKVFTIKDTSGRAELRYWINAVGQIEAACAAKDTAMQVLVAENNRLVRDKKTETKTVVQTPAWAWWLLGGVVLTGVLLTLFVFAKFSGKWQPLS